MSAEAATPPGSAHPAILPPGDLAKMGGAGLAFAGIFTLLIRLQESVGDVSGRVAVLGEQVSAARQQVSDVRQAQAAIGDDVADIQRRMAIIEAQQPTAGRR